MSSNAQTTAEKKNVILQSSAVTIDILVVINTDYVIDYCVKNGIRPSQDANNPTGIDHTNEFMICTGARNIISGQGTGDLYFQANPGDYVSFRGTSVTANSDDAIILYGIKKFDGENVFNPFVVNQVTRNGAVVPNTSTQNGIPPVQVSLNFNSYTSSISHTGNEGFKVQFGLYRLDDNGENQVLFGYFEWDPRIQVGQPS
jgi:nematocidal protein AidA